MTTVGYCRLYGPLPRCELIEVLTLDCNRRSVLILWWLLGIHAKVVVAVRGRPLLSHVLQIVVQAAFAVGEIYARSLLLLEHSAHHCYFNSFLCNSS